MTDANIPIAAIAEAIERTLRREGDPRRAVGQQADREKRIPNPPGPALALEYLGGTVPLVRRTTKDALKTRPDLEREQLIALATLLWRRDVYDLRLAAVEALMARNKLLIPEDVAAIEPFMRQAQTWALLDPLAISVLAPVVERHPQLTATLDRWSVDGDFWMRRTAMLSLLPALRRGEGDFERFAGYAAAMVEEREFFIRKAIGWVLREVSKKRPALVIDWLAPRTGRVSGVTFREAVKYLPEEDRRRLTAAFRAGQPA